MRMSEQERQSLLRGIPSVDALIRSPFFRTLAAEYGHQRLVGTLRLVLEDLRSSIQTVQADQTDQAAQTDPAGRTAAGGRVPEEQDLAEWKRRLSARHLAVLVRERLAGESQMYVRPAINATGVLLHTNLGRAPLGEKVSAETERLLTAYNTLEYDLQTGGRGSRYAGVEPLLTGLTGAEAALVVNNNAAAVLLVLTCLAQGREAIVSRGELVEIGGSFRIPDVMAASGAFLREVGTTNKTHLWDYEQAISEDTAVILKVHCSNYKIVGFTAAAEPAELAELARSRELISVYDLGSGLLHPEPHPVLAAEPTVRSAVEAGQDLVLFSGDKLLGGPQAGIIVGRADLIARLKKHPLTRALRADKYQLGALEATLRVYLNPQEIARDLPIFQMLHADLQTVGRKADILADLLSGRGIESEVVAAEGCIGGGSAPDVTFPSVALKIVGQALPDTPAQVARALSQGEFPVVCRVRQDCLLFDLRTVFDAQIERLAQAIARVLLTGMSEV